MMQQMDDFQLFLFDFDGLLINSEEIHFLAYKRMCAAHGCLLDWSFDHYCQTAHYSGEGLRTQLFALFPELEAIDPTWHKLYAEKQAIVQQLFMEGAAHLMPGVQEFLERLSQTNATSCVVTHSPDQLVNVMRKKFSIFDTIQYWITRGSYSKPKPHPECYLKAIELYAKPQERVIGFEDTPRGLTALLGTRAKPVLICTAQYPEIPAFISQGVSHYPSFNAFMIKDGQ
jgi:beta-phosphoglucomutase